MAAPKVLALLCYVLSISGTPEGNLSKTAITGVCGYTASVEELFLEFGNILRSKGGDFGWHTYDKRRHEARSLRKFILPPDLAAQVAAEPINILLERPPRTNPRKPGKYPEHPAAKALNYLNSLPPTPFNSLLKNIPAALEVIKTLPLESQPSQYWTLAAFIRHPKPIYSPSAAGKTTRIFSNGLPLLSSEVRSALCPDWIELDLKNAHLAIAARDWNIPAIQSFLSTGQSIWTKIFTDLGLEPNPATKRAFKNALYSIMFGNHIPRAKAELTMATSRPTSHGFFNLDLIKILIEARNRRFDRIRETKGDIDCFGRSLELTDEQNEKSILGQLAQSVETKLLLPLYSLAESTRDFDVMLAQHDGFSIRIRKGREKQILKRIDIAVNSEIRSGGYETGLERKI